MNERSAEFTVNDPVSHPNANLGLMTNDTYTKKTVAGCNGLMGIAIPELSLAFRRYGVRKAQFAAAQRTYSQASRPGRDNIHFLDINKQTVQPSSAATGDRFSYRELFSA